MAGSNLFGVVGDYSYWSPVGVDVYARASRDDAWEFLPFLTAVQVREGTNDNVGSATFRYDYGYVRYAEVGAYAAWDYYRLAGAYVCVVVWDFWGEAFLWEGVVEAETVRPHGSVDVPQGEQTFTAYALEHELDRAQIRGSWCDDGEGGAYYIDRAIKFNSRGRRGPQLTGNRSTAGPLFGDEASPAMWSNLDIVDYVIDRHVPEPERWIGCGQVWGLASIEEEISLEGLTPFQALNQLIRRQRGMGWRVVSDGGPVAYVYVFSCSGEGFGFGGAVLESNPDQVILDLGGLRNVDPVITFNHAARYDQIVVRGGPIVSAMSLSYTDGTLEEGWDVELEDEYNEGALGEGQEDTTEARDAARGAARFEGVYTRHRLVTPWDGLAGDGEGGGLENALPGYWPDALPDASLLAPYLRADKTFERSIPLEVEGSTSPEPEYRRPFVVFKVDPDGSFDPEAEEDTRVWCSAQKLRDLLPGEWQNCDVGVSDRELSVRVAASPPHAIAKGVFDPETDESNTEPYVDYTSMIATVALRTDAHLTAVFTAWGAGSNPRAKYLEDPDAEAWYIVPGTVIDVQQGELVRHEGGWLRDDSERLRSMALFAASWYASPRATLNVEIGAIVAGFPCGVLVRGLVGPEGYTEIGTVVTQRTWFFSPDGCKTTLTTGYEEIDFEGVRRGRRR